MRNRIWKFTKLGLAVMTLGLGVAPTVHADLFPDRELAVGYQGGPSVRMPMNNAVKGQLILGALGSVNSIELRGMRPFASRESVDFYGYGAASIWFWDGGAFHSSETAFGGGAGVGLDYDLRNLAADMPAVFFSAELGARFVNFDNYNAVDLVHVGLGLHYQF